MNITMHVNTPLFFFFFFIKTALQNTCMIIYMLINNFFSFIKYALKHFTKIKICFKIHVSLFISVIVWIKKKTENQCHCLSKK